MIMLREIRVYLGFRLDIFEDWFLLVEREMNTVQKSQINLLGNSEVNKTAPVGLGSLAIFFCSYLLGFLYRPKREGKLFRQRHRHPFLLHRPKINCRGPLRPIKIECQAAIKHNQQAKQRPKSGA